jgi:hypothetical protein
MEPSRMVKEYRKEAADKLTEVPSAVRPVHVLRATIDYRRLFTYWLIFFFRWVQVINLAPNKLGPAPLYDWHKFLWDRMRAIRKVLA